VTVVSYAWWERRLGSDPAAIGKSITIDQTTYTIIGVAPKEFFGTTVGHVPDIWVPLAMQEQLPPGHWNGRTDRSHQSLYIVARLKDGVSAQQASATVNLLFKQSLQEQAGAQPSAERLRDIQRASIELTSLARGISELRREYSLSLRILMVVVGVVLLIACANVANLLLARAAAREKEFALRLALGAGRGRLLRQLFTESFLLAGLGAIAGVLLASWGSRILVVLASSGPEPLPLDVAPNLRVLGFTLLALLLSVLIFGTAPALRAVRIELNSSLKSGKGSVASGSRSPLGKLLVVAQVALSLLLLIGAGLFVRTLINLQNVPTGFNQQNVMLFELDTTLTGYKDPQLAHLLREVEEKVEAVPGVQSASFSFFTFNQGGWTSPIFTRDQTPPQGKDQVVRQNVVGQDFFQAMGIPLVLGRGFGPQDTSKSQKVAVVNETLARRFFPSGSPIGGRFGKEAEARDEFEIVGVVKDIKYQSLTEDARPMVFYNRAQHEEVLNNLIVRFSAAPSVVVPQVRQVIRDVKPSLPVDEVLSLSEKVGRSLGPQKLVARLASVFGLLALLLSFVGLFGVLSYAVTQRTPEIGIRMALGANRSSVMRLILKQGMLLTVIM
jgi:predicted permease